MKTLKVTVLMPVYNGEKYLQEAINSILNQDFEDFEFLIINDGSTDSSANIISLYHDKRIRSIENEKNLGLITTLNKGLDLANGEYIVRMDCDDICVKSRLSVQVALMDGNKKLGASGSYYQLLRNNKKGIADFPLSNDEIKAFMIFNSPIAHPSAIIRKSLIEQYGLKYSSEFIHCEDYNLWSQIAECSELANSSKVLLKYRVHENQITGNVKFISAKNTSLNHIRLRHLKLIGILPSEDELVIHNLVSNGERANSVEQFNSSEDWLRKIIHINSTTKAVDKSFLEKIVLERWLRLCVNFYGVKKGLVHFYKSEINKNTNLSMVRKLELIKQIYYSYKRKN
jgi:glycosyltransferase involved in cell wall biosynthesis